MISAETTTTRPSRSEQLNKEFETKCPELIAIVKEMREQRSLTNKQIETAFQLIPNLHTLAETDEVFRNGILASLTNTWKRIHKDTNPKIQKYSP